MPSPAAGQYASPFQRDLDDIDGHKAVMVADSRLAAGMLRDDFYVAARCKPCASPDGKSFSIADSQRIDNENAAALWNGVKFTEIE
jgi:hypothetical protein